MDGWYMAGGRIAYHHPKPDRLTKEYPTPTFPAKRFYYSTYHLPSKMIIEERVPVDVWHEADIIKLLAYFNAQCPNHWIYFPVQEK